MLIMPPMAWKKGDLLRAFNYASVPLYGLGKGIQKGAVWLHDQGYNVYNVMPEANRFVRHHFASFWGAYALAYLAGEGLIYAAEKVSGLKNLRKWSTELSTAFSAAALATYELTLGYRGKLDWGDMGIYGLAMGLYYLLNRHHDNETPAPATTDPGAENLPKPKTT